VVRENDVSKEVYKRHIRLYRLINDAWIFTDLLGPDLKKRAEALRATKSPVKRSYRVPKNDMTVLSKRRDADIGTIFLAQYERGVFETNIVSLVSRTEAFIQDCLAIVACSYPNKLSVLADKNGIPLDLFLEHSTREDVIRRFVTMKCEGLMFGKPSEYLDKAAKVLSIELDAELVKTFIEIKASRDIIIHNGGRINKLYLDKAGNQRRGQEGEELVVDRAYFKHVIVTLKSLSGQIQRKTEDKYK